MRKKTRIGVISGFWLPKFGGAEQYLHRIVEHLNSTDFEILVFTGTRKKDNQDNGTVPVERFAPKADLEAATWFQRPLDQEKIRTLINHYNFFDAAIEWVKTNELKTVIISNPFQIFSFIHGRELHARLKDLGVRVGIAHFDLPDIIQEFLEALYKDMGTSWEVVGKNAVAQLSNALQTGDRMTAYFDMNSPMIYKPDFIFSCSDWSLRFVDPLKTVPSYVIHPTMDPEYWSEVQPKRLPYRDVLMVNPQLRKGPEIMAAVIKDADPKWTFRITKGGWGNSFKSFLPMISRSKAMQSGRVECIEYVKDMRVLNAGAGLMFFPSLVEGYGMAAVEPMFMGTPVVSSDYPAVVEAVGDGAYKLCPRRDPPAKWRKAVQEVLENREYWSQKSLKRAQELSQRQAVQLSEFGDFLKSVHAT
jgi:glycosyltransferase involved in cell wall biosynthesis